MSEIGNTKNLVVGENGAEDILLDESESDIEASDDSSQTLFESSSNFDQNENDLDEEIRELEEKIRIKQAEKIQVILDGQKERAEVAARIANLDKKEKTTKAQIEIISQKVEISHKEKRKDLEFALTFEPLMKNLKIKTEHEIPICGEGHPVLKDDSKPNTKVCDVFNCPVVIKALEEGSNPKSS